MSIFLITSETEHCLLSLLTIWIYSPVKYLSQSSVLCSVVFLLLFGFLPFPINTLEFLTYSRYLHSSVICLHAVCAFFSPFGLLFPLYNAFK